MNLIKIGQLVTSIILIILVILQQRGEGGGLVGQPTFASSRRGVEKGIFIFTFIIGFFFIFLAVLPLAL
ncbi:MAG TPA: preprotein translocase subunit SecG [Candidatus Paceibacterota bacterium]|jgi:protein translocase SecG subunit|nr:preprotein translocase subunit SecG [Candidatus Paceibacterota bacterium]HOQ15213.1 preprotein translocase subunit SecG [Candidatus Paceibacterota bacterium]HPQ22767.1 preprotein translocase subunit SecG [Candidatus Paceibacterota bacterium]